MLVDANVLLYSVDEDSPFHVSARDWLVEALNGVTRVGIPWQSLWAFLRIVTNPRAGLVTDAVLAAIYLEHGLSVVSADSDFARFPEIHWINPIAPR